MTSPYSPNTIMAFTMTSRRGFTNQPITDVVPGFVAIERIVAARDYKESLPKVTADFFGVVKGQADIAIVQTASGKPMPVLVPFGQRR